MPDRRDAVDFRTSRNGSVCYLVENTARIPNEGSIRCPLTRAQGDPRTRRCDLAARVDRGVIYARGSVTRPTTFVAFTFLLAAASGPCAAGNPSAAPGASGAARPLPEPPYELRFSHTLDGESGGIDTAFAVTALGSGEARLFHHLDAGSAPWGAAALRGTRALLWDAPVAWWFGVLLHEGFGHGGRAREAGASTGVRMGHPWEGRASYATFDSTGLGTEDLLHVYAGGTEANTIAATLLSRRAAAGARMRPIDLFFLASNRFVASDYVLRTTPDPRRDPSGFFGEYGGGGDVANYLGLLHELHGAGSGITPAGADGTVTREYRRLRRQAIWNALDPAAWWALASAVRQTARGDSTPPLPLPRRGAHRFLPVCSAEWTPNGGQTSLELVLARDRANGTGGPARSAPRWLSLVARRGRGPSGPFGALGAASAEFAAAGPWRVGGQAEIWHDPRHGAGGGARVRALLIRGPLRGLYVDAGVKSSGYWVGQPASPGAYGAFGLVFLE